MGRVLRFVVLLALIAYVIGRFTPNFHRLLTTTTFIGAVSRPTEARKEKWNAEPVPNLDMFNGCGMEGDAGSSGVRVLDRLENRYRAPSPADIDSETILEAILARGKETTAMGRCANSLQDCLRGLAEGVNLGPEVGRIDADPDDQDRQSRLQWFS